MPCLLASLPPCHPASCLPSFLPSVLPSVRPPSLPCLLPCSLLRYFWTETWVKQMSVTPPSHTIDVQTSQLHRLMPPAAHTKRGRPKVSRCDTHLANHRSLFTTTPYSIIPLSITLSHGSTTPLSIKTQGRFFRSQSYAATHGRVIPCTQTPPLAAQAIDRPHSCKCSLCGGQGGHPSHLPSFLPSFLLTFRPSFLPSVPSGRPHLPKLSCPKHRLPAATRPQTCCTLGSGRSGVNE